MTGPVDKPELLAPAGDMESFRAALMAGADAIYLGLGVLNARRRAENFTLDSVAEACRLAHLAGRRVYLTANTAVLDTEFPEAVELILSAYLSGVDAVIACDLGLIATLLDQAPQIPIHASTQMNLMNEAGILRLKDRGLARITLARELSLEQIAHLSSLGIETEVFAHGALCICYSGQCLMSSLIGSRSANRGLCAQPCRLPWELVDEWGNPASCPESVDGEHLLSPKDLCTISLLPELIEAGVSSLKIEGRMKSPEYVATVTSVYRAALDRAYEDPAGYAATPAEENLLAEAFSRGFTTAYLQGERGNDMMSYRRSNNRGTFVGRVSRIAGGLVEISAEKPLDAGDILEFWTSRGRHDQKLEAIQIDGQTVSSCPAGSHFQIRVDTPVSLGDRVFRVRSARIVDAAEELYGTKTGVATPLDFALVAKTGEPLYMSVTDAQGRTGTAQGALCEAARTKELTREDIIEHIGRLGGTPYTVASFDIVLDSGVGMGFSRLHTLRRRAIESYEEAILAPWSNRAKPVLPVIGGEHSHRNAEISSRNVGGIPSPGSVEVAVLTSDEDMARMAQKRGAVIYAPAEALTRWDGTDDVIAYMPTVVHDECLGDLCEVARHCSGAVADNYSMVALLTERDVAVEAGPHLNLLNQHSVEAARAVGCSRVWLSPELTIAQIRDLSATTDIPLDITVSGYQELMITQHCELMACGPCDRRCADCHRRRQTYRLADRKGYLFPVTTDSSGHGHIYNSIELDLTPTIGDLYRCGVSRFIVDATWLDEERVRMILGRIDTVMESRGDEGSRPFTRLDNTTTGQLFRGVL